MADETQTVAKEDIVITRNSRAPLALVWKAWTDCEVRQALVGTEILYLARLQD